MASGATPATMRFIGDSFPAFWMSPTKRTQSSSHTSCIANGCGCTVVGGGSAGNPLSSDDPRLSTVSGGKGVYGSSRRGARENEGGGGLRRSLGSLPESPFRNPPMPAPALLGPATGGELGGTGLRLGARDGGYVPGVYAPGMYCPLLAAYGGGGASAGYASESLV